MNSVLFQQIKRIVHSTDPDAVLILYGSYARGDQSNESDVDIIVLLDKDSVGFDDQKRIGYPLHDLSIENDIHISPKIFPKKMWDTKYNISSFYKNVVREGIIL